ncbi:WD40 repeat-like protein [Paxillus ammoniavirescens]|nr:WD40 repeat-like protein [Paxillus ammoniavirescens]
MLTSSRAVPAETTSVPPVVMSTSSQSVASKSASDPVPVQVFEGHEDWVICLRFCPDEDKLVTGSGDNTLRVWNRPTGAVEVLRGHDFSVWDIDVSWDGKMVVSRSADKTVRIWGRESGETMLVFQGHKYWVESVQFSADASRVVSSWCPVQATVSTGKPFGFSPRLRSLLAHITSSSPVHPSSSNLTSTFLLPSPSTPSVVTRR